MLELLAYFTYCSPTISPQLWSLWPQIVAALNGWAVDFFENVSRDPVHTSLHLVQGVAGLTACLCMSCSSGDTQ